MAVQRKRRKSPRRPRSAGVAHLHRQFIGDDPELQTVYEEHLAGAEIARQVYDLRTGAGLSQRELASLVGTTASVICRLEDADYDGHSLSMLNRIAAALNKRVEIRFVPLRRKTARSGR